MRELTRQNQLLLLATLFFSAGAFAYFPYVTTSFADFVGMDGQSITSIVAVATIASNVLAFLVSVFLPSGSSKARLIGAYVVIVASICLPLLLRLPDGAAEFWLVALAISAYRFSVAFISNFTRFLQLESMAEGGDKLKLLSYMKFSFSLGSAAGPVIGYVGLRLGGIHGLVSISSTLFVLAVLLIAAVREPPRAIAETPAAAPSTLQKLPLSRPNPAVLVISAAAMTYCFLEAQIYAYIVLSIKNVAPDFERLVSLLFTANAIILIAFLLPTANRISRIRRKWALLSLAGLTSLASVLYAPFVASEWEVVAVALLLTIGEIVIPQVLLDMATDPELGGSRLNAIATFNFFTAGLGMSVGLWIGGIAASRMSLVEASLLWLAVYLLFVLLAYFGCRVSQARIGATASPALPA